jgi:predicted CXXCH cytochrome family protein
MACHEAPEDGWFMHFRDGPHGEQNPAVSYAPEDTCAQSGCHGYANTADIPEGKTSGVTHVNKWHPEYGAWNETEDEGWNSEMVSHSEPTESFVRTKECSACHGTHEGVFANIEDAPGIFEYAPDAQPNPENVSEWRITCVACHEPHEVQEHDYLRGDFSEDSSKLCGQCHNAELGSELQAGAGHGEVHHSMWEMYSRSKFVDNSSSHPELECASCHMPGLDRPPGNFETTAGVSRQTGHSMEVNTTQLMSDRLRDKEYRKCNACHQDLDATIDEQRRITQQMIERAQTMRSEANQTMYEYGYEDTELASTLEEGTFWLQFVEAAGTGIHNPEMATERLTGAIDRFDEVKSLAYQQQVDELNEQLDEQSQEPQTTTTTPTTEPTTETETPGLGISVALVAIIGAALLAVRRWT